MKETKEFQAESQELLNLMINSIYSNKEIFLRELISNASDALDKYRYQALKAENNLPAKDYAIELIPNKKERTLIIKDNGIGMSKKEIENNLGTIARSGSKEFLKKYKDFKKDESMNIIGQFGVGFYSLFMVANKVEVLTRSAHEDKAYLFCSDGKKSYTIEDANKDESGTEIKVYLKKDEKDGEEYSSYLDEWKIKDLVKKYSDYIRYPIKMMCTHHVNKKDEKGEDIKDQYEDITSLDILNSMVPLWKKNKNEIKEEEINEFYKNKYYDYENPLMHLLIHVDGLISYDALLFIPSHAPLNLYSENYEKGLDLYAKGIFIKEKCKELIPDYLKFVKGLVESNDFSLNISREMLQSSPLLRKIEDNLEKKIIDKLLDLKEHDKDQYLKFYKEFGNHIKFGIYSSYGSKKDLLKDLIMFKSLKHPEEYISLKEYLENMKKEQEHIYYASSKNLDQIKLLPQLEKYRQDDVDVLYFDQEVDEFMAMMMNDYEKKTFKNISSIDQNELSKEEKEEIDTLVASNKRLLDNILEALKGEVDEVTFSNKLVSSPVCITTKDGLSMSMEETLNQNPARGENEVKARKVLEINPKHNLFKALQKLTDDEEMKQYGSLLYDEALLLEGFEIKNKQNFVEKINELLVKAIN